MEKVATDMTELVEVLGSSTRFSLLLTLPPCPRYSNAHIVNQDIRRLNQISANVADSELKYIFHYSMSFPFHIPKALNFKWCLHRAPEHTRCRRGHRHVRRQRQLYLEYVSHTKVLKYCMHLT